MAKGQELSTHQDSGNNVTYLGDGKFILIVRGASCMAESTTNVTGIIEAGNSGGVKSMSRKGKSSAGRETFQ